MKKKYTKIKEIILLIAMDLAAVALSTILALVITQGELSFSFDVLYWALINVAAALVFMGVFRLYTIVFVSVGLFDTLKTFCATLCIFCIIWL